MTKTGRVKRVGAAFGFIKRDDGSPDIFFHVKQTVGMEPLPNERVQFELGTDRNGRPSAQSVRVIG